MKITGNLKMIRPLTYMISGYLGISILITGFNTAKHLKFITQNSKPGGRDWFAMILDCKETQSKC